MLIRKKIKIVITRNAGEDTKKLDYSYIGGNKNGVGYYRKYFDNLL